MIKSNSIPAGCVNHNWKTILPKKFSHHCEKFMPNLRLPILRDMAKGLGIPRESNFESQWNLVTGIHRLGRYPDSTLGGHKQNLGKPGPRGKKKRQETEPDMPVSI